ncbi:unnamed protein product [Gongylonema pulchrum]|uniref:Uncharacterized protein n=1 Tax=Gongylonema pulchrum TaxID=637853 RepID=A0A183DPN4_9BILA|nr:unnamed protein product [Gongylonema pulchrum]
MKREGNSSFTQLPFYFKTFAVCLRSEASNSAFWHP